MVLLLSRDKKEMNLGKSLKRNISVLYYFISLLRRGPLAEGHLGGSLT